MSYNSLHVPLDIGTWQCTLVPAREFYHEWGYRQRWDPFADRDVREEMKRQIEIDRRAFDLYFRPNYDFRQLIARDIDAIRSFLSDQLNTPHWDLPTNNAGIERTLKRAVSEAKLVPIVNRDWGARPMTYRPTPAPLRWPPSVDSPQVRVVPYGGGLSASVGGGPSLGVAETVASVADDSDGGFDWLGVAETMAEAALGSGGGDANDGDDGLLAQSLTDDDTSTPLGDAQPFEYLEDLPGGDVFDIAKTPNTGEPGTWYTNSGSGQMRLFGTDGNPVVDLDFDHFHNGLKPHAHNWNGGARDGGDDVVPFSPWNP
ncbi:hypothetical protein [Burkholderia pyrrocinia]|uniref:hypothetical protein n=1 Tax=Burkholderia pyrrocinia TaxID=60550 RepID=UPI0015885D7E|nr:hypothetical protein [Burkholderia pyrrocinia]